MLEARRMTTWCFYLLDAFSVLGKTPRVMGMGLRPPQLIRMHQHKPSPPLTVHQ